MGEVVCETLPLLDELAQRMGCEYLSDLRFLDALGRHALGCALNAFPSRYAGLWEWNDALAYLTWRAASIHSRCRPGPTGGAAHPSLR